MDVEDYLNMFSNNDASSEDESDEDSSDSETNTLSSPPSLSTNFGK